MASVQQCIYKIGEIVVNSTVVARLQNCNGLISMKPAIAYFVYTQR
jgi:hypothetical protein